ncbi:MAG: hypothetical protein GXY98_01755, partial [Erysipelothrix sp.]|nr:hypothetical protein [Erysipelothrix sp.]
IMHYLNERKDAQRKWREAAIYKILRNPIYYGCFSYYDIEIENHSPAIISKELFHRASKKRANSEGKETSIFLIEKGCILNAIVFLLTQVVAQEQGEYTIT